jgi:hypothetical protein
MDCDRGPLYASSIATIHPEVKYDGKASEQKEFYCERLIADTDYCI